MSKIILDKKQLAALMPTLPEPFTQDHTIALIDAISDQVDTYTLLNNTTLSVNQSFSVLLDVYRTWKVWLDVYCDIEKTYNRDRTRCIKNIVTPYCVNLHVIDHRSGRVFQHDTANGKGIRRYRIYDAS